MASWGSYVFELCRINANQGLTAEIDWNYTSWSRRCRKILIGLVVRGAKTVVVRGKNRILTRNRKKPEMTVPISFPADRNSQKAKKNVGKDKQICIHSVSADINAVSGSVWRLRQRHNRQFCGGSKRF